MKLASFAALLLVLPLASGCAARQSAVAPSTRQSAVALDASAPRDAGAPQAAARPAARAERRPLCRMRVDRVHSVRAARAVSIEPAQPEHQCPERDPMCDTVDRAPRGADVCYVSNDHIARDERASQRGPRPGAPARSAPWDRRTPPRYIDLVERHLRLGEPERALLARNGFVALERRAYPSYAVAFHEVFREQLPVFISVDAALHAIFSAHSTMLDSIEREQLAPALDRMLLALRATLARERAQWPPQVRADLDLYLTVALRLLHEETDEEDVPRSIRSLEGQDEQIGAWVGDAIGAIGLERRSLFGRDRMVDFSQFAPRGHYAESNAQGQALSTYFRAMQWLSRVEFNLRSRDGQSSAPERIASETPREALCALALARLVERAGASGTLAQFERVYQSFGGRREDVSLPELARIGARVPLSQGEAFSSLSAALSQSGAGSERTARTHFTAEGVRELPVIATMMGPRIVPDVGALEGLVHDVVRGRERVSAADVGYLLGHRAAASAMLRDDLQRFPTLQPQLDRGATQLRADVARGEDLYARWLRAITTLAEPMEGEWPSFARTPAYGDLRMNSALVGYAQIRHNYVLLAAQGYDAYGCEIPDGYVEPAVETYRALVAWTRAAAGIDRARARFYRRMESVLQTLLAIAERELRGEALTEAQRRWIAMVSEYVPRGGRFAMSGQPPKWTGWYFDLFADREISANRGADFIADYMTLTSAGEVRYLGARAPMLGVFVVDTGGAPRVMVGPVARGFERSAAIATPRLDDEQSRSLGATGARADWRASYSAEGEPLDEELVRIEHCDSGEARIGVDELRPGEALWVTALDHHGEPSSDEIRAAPQGTGTALVAFDASAFENGEGLRVRLVRGSMVREVVLANALGGARGAGELE